MFFLSRYIQLKNVDKYFGILLNMTLVHLYKSKKKIGERKKK